MQGRQRLSLVEYGSPTDLSHAFKASIGADLAEASLLLNQAGKRVAENLGFSKNPIIGSADEVRAVNFAGLIRLTPSLELEVAPKFLGLDDRDSTWREDFFFLSSLSRHGKLLTSERLTSSGGTSRDLATLVAHAIVCMYEDRKRRPLRNYRRIKTEDFYIEGDPEPIDLIFPTPDGFEQNVVRFDRHNLWNADIAGAAKELLPEVSDPSVARTLVRLIEDLAPQKAPSRRRSPLPSRQIAWKPLHDLSVDVLKGLGLNYKHGTANAPGYVTSTWQSWEYLLTLAMRLGFGQAAILAQSKYYLGKKIKEPQGLSQELSVFPDCVIKEEGSRPKIILDAKYKGHIEKSTLRISEADIYESLAFAKATECNNIVLAYPASLSLPKSPVGTCNIFERIKIGKTQIIGIQIEVRGISRLGALEQFSSQISQEIIQIFR